MDASGRMQRLSGYLKRKLWEFQDGDPGVTMAEFAAWLGVSAGALGHWMNAVRLPSERNAHRLAACLGAEVYQILEYAAPDSDLQFVIAVWDRLDEAAQKELAALAERYYAENQEGKGKRGVFGETP